MFKFNLGAQVKDKKSGFVGTIIGRADYVDLPKDYLVMAIDDNVVRWIEEDRLELCYGE